MNTTFLTVTFSLQNLVGFFTLWCKKRKKISRINTFWEVQISHFANM